MPCKCGKKAKVGKASVIKRPKVVYAQKAARKTTSSVRTKIRRIG